MDIIIDIGTLEQKSQIEQELLIFNKIVNEFDPPLKISQVVLPLDFDR